MPCKNPEKRREYRHRYRAEHLEECRKRDRERCAADPAAGCQRSRKYRATHPKEVREAARKYREANREKINECQRKEYALHPERPRRAKLKRKYNLTPEEYELLVARQDGACAICERPLGGKGLVVDHDHITEVVRGLLCGNCNRAMGYLRDNPALLRRAADYLERRRH